MINYLKGNIIHLDENYLVLDVNGVGYKVFAGNDLLSSNLNTGKELEIWTFLSVKEQALDLYGFKEKSELDFFELLLTVSGIGPKSAMSILNNASPSTIKQALIKSDISHLTTMSGISKKIAEKIILELKNKKLPILEKESNVPEEGGENIIEALEALLALGYREKDAKEALKQVANEYSDTKQRITESLKLLSSK